MAEQLNTKIAEVKLDDLVYATHETSACHVTVASGQGVLKRGTVLALNADGKCVILGTDAATANCILAKDIDATDADAVAPAYREGHFNIDALIAKEGYEIKSSDKEELRKLGIILSQSL